MSDLITVIDNDKSQSVNVSNTAIGATVIKAKKGSTEPVLFYPKSSKRILDYFGIPDIGSEGVDDVLTYNNNYPIWVSAPSTDGKHGGVLVTDSGTVPFVGGKENKTINFSEIVNTEQIAVADGETTEFTFTLTDYTNYVQSSIDILVDGVPLSIIASADDPEILTTDPDVGSGTFTKSTGVLSFTFMEAPIEGSVIDVNYLVDRSEDTYFAIFNKNPQVDDLKVKITLNPDNDFVLDLQNKIAGKNTFSTISGFPKTGSIMQGKENGFGQIIYLETLFEQSDYITVAVNRNKVFDTFTPDASYVSFAGGVRGTTGTSEIAEGWDYFKQISKYRADVFFDTTLETTVPNIFDNLRKYYQKYAYYICPTDNDTPENVISSISSIMTDEKGIAFYWGHGKIKNTYTGEFNISTLMGRVALRLADMNDVFNGLAPAFYNENGRHGGQLGSGIVEMFYDANETQQQLLADARINPIIVHPSFGTVIVRERTSQSLQSDYASIGHTRLRDYLIRNIIEQALPYQLYKLNDVDHRARVSSQIDKIIEPTASEPFNLLREYIVKCDGENNNDDVMAREEFVVSVAIKFTKFSKKIFLYFTNSAQGVDVSEDV